MPRATNTTFNAMIKPDPSKPHMSAFSVASKWNDAPLAVGTAIEIVDGADAGARGEIVAIERAKHGNVAPKLTLQLEDGRRLDAATTRWRRHNHTPPIWSGPERPLGVPLTDE